GVMHCKRFLLLQSPSNYGSVYSIVTPRAINQENQGCQEVSLAFLECFGGFPEAHSHSCPFVPGETVDALASYKERTLFGADRKMWRRNAMEDACPLRRSG